MNIHSLFFGSLLALSAPAVYGQIDGPEPPITGTWADRHAIKLKNRLRQPPPPPASGFWVVEENVRIKSPVIARFYTDQQRELRADTLPNRRLNLKHRAVVSRLNERLRDLLNGQLMPAPVAIQTSSQL